MKYTRKVTVTSSFDHKTQSITLPYVKNGAPNETLDFMIDLMLKPGDPTIFQLIPNDCLQILDVNGRQIPIIKGALAQSCNTKSGFAIQLKGFLKHGLNTIHIQIVNNGGGPTGLHFEPLRAHK